MENAPRTRRSMARVASASDAPAASPCSIRWAMTSVSVADVEAVAAGHELGPQLGVVLDDPVVDDGHPAGAVEVGVGVLGGGAARGWPTGCGRCRRRGRWAPSAVSSARSATDSVPPAARPARSPRRPPGPPRPSRSPGTRAGAGRRGARGTASASPVTPMMPHMVPQATWAPAARVCPERRPRRTTAAASWAATASAWASARASTITRTSGSVPLGRSSTRPSWPELGLGLAPRPPTPRRSRPAARAGGWAR